MIKKNKILHVVENYYPSIGGMQEVVRQLSERLVCVGFDVTVATSYHPNRKESTHCGVKITDFNVSGNMVKGIKGDVEKYTHFLLNSDFDVITIFAAQQWSSDLMFPIIDRINGKKVFVPTGFSALYNPDFFDYFENMKKWMNNIDMNVFLSKDYRDINFAKNNNIKRRILIPNGASKDDFIVDKDNNFRREFGIDEKSLLIILVGSHTGAKGHREAIEIFKKAKISNSVFLIIGNYFQNNEKQQSILYNIKKRIKKILGFVCPKYKMNCPELCETIEAKYNKSKNSKKYKKSIMIRSLKRNDTIQAYLNSDIFLFPSNIECSPIVLFECMASKTPFLTSDSGNAKEIIDWSNGGLLLPTKKTKFGFCRVNIRKSVKMLEDLFYDSKIRKQLGSNGYKTWEKKFTWENIAEQYKELYKELIKKDK